MLEEGRVLSSDTHKHLNRKRHKFIAPRVERLAVQPHVVAVHLAFIEGVGPAVAVRASCTRPVAQMGGGVDVEDGDVDEGPLVSHVRRLGVQRAAAVMTRPMESSPCKPNKRRAVLDGDGHPNAHSVRAKTLRNNR